MSIGRHESQHPTSITWLTPPWILERLGTFDLDPCAAPEPRPWDTARRHISPADGNGLTNPWAGRVWLNPPYNKNARHWLARLAHHGTGTALLFARTDTAWFTETVFAHASALLFLSGRVHFCRPDGTTAPFNAGAPSVLAAYGTKDAEILAESQFFGALIPAWTTTPGDAPLVAQTQLSLRLSDV